MMIYYRFKELIGLGQQLIDRNPNLTEVKETVDVLHGEQEALNRGWQEKEKWLQQCVKLQMFNREADKIDATTKSHEAFLDYVNLGVRYFI